MITGKTLIDWGYQAGPWFPGAIEAARRAQAQGADDAAVRAVVASLAPPPVLALRMGDEMPLHFNIEAATPDEVENVAAVERHMRALMRVPTLVAGAVMPDACPSGSALGTIPVGGVVAAKEAIHPGMHSADICCSMAVTIFAEAEPKAMLDAGMRLSHFGGGGRSEADRIAVPAGLLEKFAANRFLKNGLHDAAAHFATQGDGNHFFYVGRVASSGRLALVTHHGSRKPGASLYKAGMAMAEKFRQKLSPATPAHNAWIPSETAEGEAYWAALQLIRDWTKASHFAIHDRIVSALGSRIEDRFWNEHNFVFRKSDGLFYHAKGATPAFAGFSADTNGLTLIPLNMAQPILIARGKDASHGLGFAPHGAGRNLSRTGHLKRLAGRSEAQVLAEETQGLDVRFFSGVPDLSELPSAYKDASAVRAQIEQFGLAEVVDVIEPLGSIMAGNWQSDPPWKRAKAAKEQEASRRV